MTCQCRVCTDHRRWMAAINPQTDEAKAAFEEIMDRLAGAETDAVYYRMKLEGTWPGDEPTENRPVKLTRERAMKLLVEYHVALGDREACGDSLQGALDVAREACLVAMGVIDQPSEPRS